MHTLAHTCTHILRQLICMRMRVCGWERNREQRRWMKAECQNSCLLSVTRSLTGCCCSPQEIKLKRNLFSICKLIFLSLQWKFMRNSLEIQPKAWHFQCKRWNFRIKYAHICCCCWLFVCVCVCVLLLLLCRWFCCGVVAFNSFHFNNIYCLLLHTLTFWEFLFYFFFFWNLFESGKKENDGSRLYLNDSSYSYNWTARKDREKETERKAHSRKWSKAKSQCAILSITFG